MRKESIRLSKDLIWNLKRDAKSQNKELDYFVREIYESWKKSSQNALNKEKEANLYATRRN